MTEKMHESRGSAIFACKKCSKAVTLSWESGYPAAEAPQCVHGEMERVDGDDHTVLVTEDELLEAEVRAELAAEQRLLDRERRKAEIRQRLQEATA